MDTGQATLPFQPQSDTSRAAARQLDPEYLTETHEKILSFLRSHGPSTDEEIQNGLSLNPSTQRPRRVELRSKGLIQEAGKGRTRSGRSAVKWSIT